jgi:cell division protein ZapA
MGDKNRVLVRIYGQEYTMAGYESREYMQQIANYVDDKMVDISENNKRLSTAMVAVLTSLNIADEYVKTKKQLLELKKETMEPLKELEQIRNQMAATTTEFETIQEQNKQMVQQMEEYRKTIQQLEEENQSISNHGQTCDRLEKEIEQLKIEINAKDKEVEKVVKMNDDLQMKLFDSQIKYVQARKELEAFIETFDDKQKK